MIIIFAIPLNQLNQFRLAVDILCGQPWSPLFCDSDFKLKFKQNFYYFWGSASALNLILNDSTYVICEFSAPTIHNNKGTVLGARIESWFTTSQSIVKSKVIEYKSFGEPSVYVHSQTGLNNGRNLKKMLCLWKKNKP